MTSKIYKTSRGQSVDMGALALKNENVLAVSPGGTKMNARGDRIDSNNRVIDSKSSQVGRQIQDQTQQVHTASKQRVVSSTKAAKEAAKPKQYAPVKPAVEEVLVGLDDQPVKALNETNKTATETTTNEVAPTSNEGLASAIARAKNKKAE